AAVDDRDLRRFVRGGHAAAARVVARVFRAGADDGATRDDVVARRVAERTARGRAVVHVVALEVAVVVADAPTVHLVVARLATTRAVAREVAVVPSRARA